MGSIRNATPALYDVLIIGGGPAGLSIAGSLARQTHTALILDSGTYRNAVSKHMHGVPGFDHVDPAEFRAKCRQDLKARYASIEYKIATINEIKKLDDGNFEAVDEDGGVYRSRKLGLGTGVRDKLEETIPGYAECWGRGVFHCLFCHGFEERGAASVGVLAGGIVNKAEIITHVARMAKRLSEHVNIYTNGMAGLDLALKPLVHSSKITVDNRKVSSIALIDNGPGVKMKFEDGSMEEEGFVVSHPSVEQRASNLMEQLGLSMTPMGDIEVNPPFNETSVKGCFAAGDAATMMKGAVQAIYMGSMAGIGAVAQLQVEMEQKDEL